LEPLARDDDRKLPREQPFGNFVGGVDGTVVDAYGDVDHAPRRILATALKQIAKTRRDEARWRELVRRGRGAAAGA
jgi:hypothetical protein